MFQFGNLCPVTLQYNARRTYLRRACALLLNRSAYLVNASFFLLCSPIACNERSECALTKEGTTAAMATANTHLRMIQLAHPSECRGARFSSLFRCADFGEDCY